MSLPPSLHQALNQALPHAHSGAHSGSLSRLVDLSGKTALITGASSGLGAHFAKTLAGAGAKVALAARRLDRLEETAHAVTEAGGVAFVFECDVTSVDDVRALVETVGKRAPPIDILVNNAGVGVTKPVLEHKESDWDFVVDTNLKGAFFCAQAVARHIADAGKGGSIVNIASLLGRRVSKNISAYAIAKAGLVQMTKAMALEWARFDLRVNAIAPGYISTDMNSVFLESAAGEKMLKTIPMRRFGKPSDLDGPLLLLCGEGGAFMTGSVISADGGHELHM